MVNIVELTSPLSSPSKSGETERERENIQNSILCHWGWRAGLDIRCSDSPPRYSSFSFKERSRGEGGDDLGKGPEEVEVKERGASKGRADAGGGAGMETRPGQAGRLSPDLGLGDDVIHNHVDHGSGSKGQRVRQDGLGQHHREGAEDPGQRLHHAAELPVPRREQTRPHGEARADTPRAPQAASALQKGCIVLHVRSCIAGQNHLIVCCFY